MNVISQQKAFLWWYQNQVLSSSIPSKPESFLPQQAYHDLMLKFNQFPNFLTPQQLFYQSQNFGSFPNPYLTSKLFSDSRSLMKEEFAFPSVIKEEETLPVKNEFQSPSTDSILPGQEHTINEPIGEFSEEGRKMKKNSKLLGVSKKIVKKPSEEQPKKARGGEKVRKIRNLWTKREDEQLLSLIEIYGRKWTKIGEIIGGRSCKQVRDRYLNNLRSGITSQNWTDDEDELLKLMYYIVGSRWSKIAVYLPGRCESQVKNRFYKQIKGDLRPRTDKPHLLKIIQEWKTAYNQGAQVKIEHFMEAAQERTGAKVCSILDDIFKSPKSSERVSKSIESLFEMKTPMEWLNTVIAKLEGDKAGSVIEEEESQLSLKQEFSEQRST
jgi:hypothetical protein